MANLLWNVIRKDVAIGNNITSLVVYTANDRYYAYFAPLEANKTYTLSLSKSADFYIGLCKKTKNPYYVTATTSDFFNAIPTKTTGSTLTFTTGADDTFVVIFFIASATTNVMLNEGSTASTYEVATATPTMYYDTYNWFLNPSVNDGYPFNDSSICQTGTDVIDMSAFKDRIWCIHPTTNEGYPFILGVTDIVAYPELPFQYDYVSVYSSTETDFTHNGLRILCPSECTIDEELNGAYELTMSHPFDEDENYKFLRENNIIKANGQLFRIYSLESVMDSSGVMVRNVNARHIFYDLNGYWIRNKLATALTATEAITALLTGAENGTPSQFTGTSDMSGAYAQTFENVSTTFALIGSENSVLSVFGGVLNRDNFTFTINAMSSTISFEVNYGCDMTEVSESIDFSNVFNSVHVFFNVKSSVEGVADTLYHRIASYDTESGITMPFDSRTDAHIDLEIDTQQPDPDVLADMARYWLASNAYPIINYSVGIASLKGLDEYKDFENLQNFELGSIGIIRNADLGIETTQQIVKKSVDGITGDVLSIELGCLKPSFTANRRFDLPSYTAQQIENTIAVTTPTA